MKDNKEACRYGHYNKRDHRLFHKGEPCPLDRDTEGHSGSGSEDGASQDSPDSRDTQGHLGSGLAEGIALADVLDELANFNRRFIFHKDDFVHDVIALWTAHTYSMDKWNITPRLYINAPQAGAGKSTQGKVISSLSSNGIKVASSTPAFIFAKITENKGNVTLLLDEADNIWSKGRDTSELQALINEGYEYGATVGRGNATDAGIKGVEYESFCPVVIIGVKNSMIPQTTLSRCIDIKMHLAPIGEGSVRPQRFIPRKYQDETERLKERLQSATVDIPAFKELEPPEGLSLRSWDIWEPLFVIAEIAGGDWPERVLRAAQRMNDVEVTLSPAQKVLILTYEHLQDAIRATPSEIAEQINQQDEMFSLDGQRVSYYLRQYGVDSVKSNGSRVIRLEDVTSAVEQWLPEQVHPSPKPSLAVPADPVGEGHPSPKPSLSDPAEIDSRDIQW